MGQKTNPIGFRVGIHRKWAYSWYENINDKLSNLSFGVITFAGGTALNSMEDILVYLFKRYSVTKFTNTPRIIIVDFRLFKGFAGHVYGFLIYTKLTKRK
jgi:hypothetical protein